ncbi:MAG: type III secretion system outer membrane ring subunit SctC [Granulosicoccus sp.]
MNIPFGFRQRCLAAVGSCMLLLSLIAPAAQAAEIPGLEKIVVLNAREQPVDLFFGELFGQLGVPVRVDEGIEGTVNGDFRKSAGDLLNEISSAFQLAVYFDGAVGYVYPANDVTRSILYMPSSTSKSVVRAADKLGMLDSRNTLSSTEVGLVVTGARRFVEQVDSLANALRKKTKTPVATHDTYKIFELKYAWADDVSMVFGGETVVIPGVASLIRSLIEPGALGAPTVTRTPGSSSLDGLRGKGLKGQGLQEVAINAPQSPQLLTNQKKASGFSSGGGSTARTRIVADPLSNSVIIRDRADRMATYESLIASLDKEPQMIEIEATIIDLDTDKLRELGINWRLQRNDDQGLLGNGTFTDELLRPNTDISPRGEGGVVSLVLGSQQQFIARIRALETQGAARIVSKPHVMTLSNVEALLDTTSTFFVRVAGQEEVDLFDVKVGTTLRVTPHVYERAGRSQIKLRVNILDGSTSSERVDSIPIVEESTINTQAIIDVGQSLLIGGLVREIKGNGVSRVPVLGSIPGLGALFRTQTKTSSRQERMFLITPRLSTPRVAGKRFSAPVLAGSEGDIISSSSLRLNQTRQALSLLDEANPVEQTLPRGQTLSSSNAALVEPFQPVAPIAPTQLREVDQPEPRSLRDRLLRPESSPSAQPQKLMVRSEQPLPDRQLSIPEETNKQAPAYDEWQTVGEVVASKPLTDERTSSVFSVPVEQVRVADTQGAIAAQQGGAAGEFDPDSWQVVTP